MRHRVICWKGRFAVPKYCQARINVDIGSRTGVVTLDELAGQVDLESDMQRALNRAANDLAVYIQELILSTTRPGRVLTGSDAPFWPGLTWASARNFVVSIDTDGSEIMEMRIQNRIQGYPERVDREQGALDKFFAAHRGMIEERFSQLISQHLEEEVLGTVGGGTRAAAVGTVAGRLAAGGSKMSTRFVQRPAFGAQ